MEDGSSLPPGRMVRPPAGSFERLKAYFRSSPERRLDPLVTAYRRELDARKGSSVEKEPWFETAEQLLVAAEDALYVRRDANVAWACYLSAQRSEIEGFDETKVQTISEALTKEGEAKLASWRRDALSSAVSIAGDPNQALPSRRSALQQATFIRDEEAQNRYFRLEELRRQLLIIAGVMAIALLGVLISAIRNPLDLGVAPSSTRAATWKFVLLFGMLGGSLSSIRSVTQQRRQVQISQQLTQSAIAAFRPLMGGAAALAMYAFLEAGIVTFVSDTNATVLAAAFAAGFSERLIVGAIGKLGDSEERDAGTTR